MVIKILNEITQHNKLCTTCLQQSCSDNEQCRKSPLQSGGFVVCNVGQAYQNTRSVIASWLTPSKTE